MNPCSSHSLLGSFTLLFCLTFAFVVTTVSSSALNVPLEQKSEEQGSLEALASRLNLNLAGNATEPELRQYPSLPPAPYCNVQTPCAVIHGACTCGGYDPGYCRDFCQYWHGEQNNLQYGYTCAGCRCNCNNPHYVG